MQKTNAKSLHITPLVFLFSLLMMLATSGGHLDVWDGKGYFLLTQNLVKHQSLILHPDLISPDASGEFTTAEYLDWIYEGRHNAQRPPTEPVVGTGGPLLPLMGVPFYIIADNVFHYSAVKLTPYFTSSLVVALIGTVVFAFGTELYKSRRIGFVLSLIVGIGSFVWPYTSLYLQQPLSALTAISCLYFLYVSSHGFSRSNLESSKTNSPVSGSKLFLYRTSPILAGISLGLQTLAHPGTFMIVPGLTIIAIILFRKDKRKLLMFSIGLLSLFGVQGLLNYYNFGSVAEFGYIGAATIPHTLSEGLYGLIISPGYGLITYFPLIVLVPIGAYLLWRQNRLFCIAFLYVFFSVWGFYGSFEEHWGWIGVGWGPRYLITIVPVLAMILGPIVASTKCVDKNYSIDGLRGGTSKTLLIKNVLGTSSCFLRRTVGIVFILLAISGFFVNLLGVLVFYQLGAAYGWVALRLNELPGSKLTAFNTWYPQYSAPLLHWYTLTTDWWKTHMLPASPFFYGWELCVPDNFLYCNFGVIPLLVVLIAVGGLGFITTRKILKS